MIEKAFTESQEKSAVLEMQQAKSERDWFQTHWKASQDELTSLRAQLSRLEAENEVQQSKMKSLQDTVAKLRVKGQSATAEVQNQKLKCVQLEQISNLEKIQHRATKEALDAAMNQVEELVGVIQKLEHKVSNLEGSLSANALGNVSGGGTQFGNLLRASRGSIGPSTPNRRVSVAMNYPNNIALHSNHNGPNNRVSASFGLDTPVLAGARNSILLSGNQTTGSKSSHLIQSSGRVNRQSSEALHKNQNVLTLMDFNGIPNGGSSSVRAGDYGGSLSNIRQQESSNDSNITNKNSPQRMKYFNNKISNNIDNNSNAMIVKEFDDEILKSYGNDESTYQLLRSVFSSLQSTRSANAELLKRNQELTVMAANSAESELRGEIDDWRQALIAAADLLQRKRIEVSHTIAVAVESAKLRSRDFYPLAVANAATNLRNNSKTQPNDTSSVTINDKSGNMDKMTHFMVPSAPLNTPGQTSPIFERRLQLIARGQTSSNNFNNNNSNNSPSINNNLSSNGIQGNNGASIIMSANNNGNKIKHELQRKSKLNSNGHAISSWSTQNSAIYAKPTFKLVKQILRVLFLPPYQTPSTLPRKLAHRMNKQHLTVGKNIAESIIHAIQDNDDAIMDSWSTFMSVLKEQPFKRFLKFQCSSIVSERQRLRFAYFSIKSRLTILHQKFAHEKRQMRILHEQEISNLKSFMHSKAKEAQAISQKLETYSESSISVATMHHFFSEQVDSYMLHMQADEDDVRRLMLLYDEIYTMQANTTAAAIQLGLLPRQQNGTLGGNNTTQSTPNNVSSVNIVSAATNTGLTSNVSNVTNQNSNNSPPRNGVNSMMSNTNQGLQQQSSLSRDAIQSIKFPFKACEAVLISLELAKRRLSEREAKLRQLQLGLQVTKRDLYQHDKQSFAAHLRALMEQAKKNKKIAEQASSAVPVMEASADHTVDIDESNRLNTTNPSAANNIRGITELENSDGEDNDSQGESDISSLQNSQNGPSNYKSSNRISNRRRRPSISSLKDSLFKGSQDAMDSLRDQQSAYAESMWQKFRESEADADPVALRKRLDARAPYISRVSLPDTKEVDAQTDDETTVSLRTLFAGTRVFNESVPCSVTVLVLREEDILVRVILEDFEWPLFLYIVGSMVPPITNKNSVAANSNTNNGTNKTDQINDIRRASTFADKIQEGHQVTLVEEKLESTSNKIALPSNDVSSDFSAEHGRLIMENLEIEYIRGQPQLVLLPSPEQQRLIQEAQNSTSNGVGGENPLNETAGTRALKLANMAAAAFDPRPRATLDLDCAFNDLPLLRRSVVMCGVPLVTTVAQCKRTRHGMVFYHLSVYCPVTGWARHSSASARDLVRLLALPGQVALTSLLRWAALAFQEHSSAYSGFSMPTSSYNGIPTARSHGSVSELVSNSNSKPSKLVSHSQAGPHSSRLISNGSSRNVNNLAISNATSLYNGTDSNQNNNNGSTTELNPLLVWPFDFNSMDSRSRALTMAILAPFDSELPKTNLLFDSLTAVPGWSQETISINCRLTQELRLRVADYALRLTAVRDARRFTQDLVASSHPGSKGHRAAAESLAKAAAAAAEKEKSGHFVHLDQKTTNLINARLATAVAAIPALQKDAIAFSPEIIDPSEVCFIEFKIQISADGLVNCACDLDEVAHWEEEKIMKQRKMSDQLDTNEKYKLNRNIKQVGNVYVNSDENDSPDNTIDNMFSKQDGIYDNQQNRSLNNHNKSSTGLNKQQQPSINLSTNKNINNTDNKLSDLGIVEEDDFQLQQQTTKTLMAALSSTNPSNMRKENRR